MLSLVTENQLDAWVRGNASIAQSVIVELIWRLVAASCPKPRERRFPLGDSIGQHGPDGILDVDLAFDPFVPETRSLWEIGTGLKAGAKATDDYKDLTDNVPVNVRNESTFVFVTPLSGRRDWEHTWKEEAQATWLEERRKRGDWKDVRVIDGTKLIDWLHHFPPVEIWLARVICGLQGQQIEIPEQHWAVVKSIGEPPPLIPSIFLANRAEACGKLKEVLDGTAVQLKLATHFSDQSIDFVCAYLASLDAESGIDVAGRCLIVSGTDAWNTVCDQWRNFILIADPALDLSGDTGTKLIQKARKAGHAVIFGGPHGGLPDPASVPLRMPRSHELKEHLEKAGYTDQRARMLADRSGGHLGSLLRLLQNLSVLPAWAERTDAAELAIAAVLGSWSDKSEADRAIVEGLLGKAYGEWIGKMRDFALVPGTPLIQRDGAWKVVARYEAWFALGPRLFDDHIERFKKAAVLVLREQNPMFELPAEKRFAASIYGKVSPYTHLLRNGLAESLALLGSHPKALSSCSFGKPELTAAVSVREIMSGADWMLWASLNDILPLLAEAAPTEFLDAVETALNSNPCPFDMVFKQEGDGITSGNYMTGLLWALETLAWNAEFITRVIVILGELAMRDPGGNWANRPANSILTILLPWLPQTCAPVAKRKYAVQTLIHELPDVAWKLLLGLLPQSHQISMGTRKPAWREIIDENWSKEVTHGEYLEQIAIYAELAIGIAKKDVAKLAEIINHIDDLPPPAYEKVIEHLSSASIVGMPQSEKARIWTKLVSFVSKHKKFADAEWAMPAEQVNKIAKIAELLAPDSPFFLYQRLFSEREFDLYEDKKDFQEEHKELELRRQKAAGEVLSEGGMKAVLDFAKVVESPWRVGIALGIEACEDTDNEIIPQLLETETGSVRQFTGGFVLGRFNTLGWKWVDKFKIEQWTQIQKGQFLAYLPFTSDTWKRSSQFLGEDESAYWTRANANPYGIDKNWDLAVDRLIMYGRPHAAINCLSRIGHGKQTVDNKLAIRALLAALNTSENVHAMDAYDIINVIKVLQDDPSVNQEELFQIEWAYLPILERPHNAFPKKLEQRMADDPSFFCEVIRVVYRSKNDKEKIEESTEQRKQVATNAYRLLTKWRIPPGIQNGGTFSGDVLNTWLGYVKASCASSGHLEVAMTQVGHVFINVPPDPDGLWIHRSAASALNAKDAGDMRSGFHSGLFNSRGVHWVDPEGKEERKLAVKYKEQAEAVETAGYYHVAATLRELASSYEREAERRIGRDLFEE